MKCDRRWWNDGRIEREKAENVGHTLNFAAQASPLNLRDEWLTVMDEHIRRSMDESWRKLMEGDPNGKPWHEVLAHWLPETSGEQVFFGSPALTCSRQINITPEQAEKMARGPGDKP